MNDKKYKYLVKVEWSMRDQIYKTYSQIACITIQKLKLEKNHKRDVEEYGSKVFFNLKDAKKYIKELKKNYQYDPPKIKDLHGLL